MVIVWLFFSELNYIFNTEIRSELLFENLNTQHIPASIDIEVYNMPCEIIDLQARTNMQYGNRVTKFHLIRYTDVKDKHSVVLMEKRRSIDQVYEAYQNKDGCRIEAKVYLDFLVNSFTVGFSNIGFLQYMIQKDGRPPIFNMDHKINHLSFGPNLESLATAFTDKLNLQAFNTLGEHSAISEENDERSKTHSYYLQVIPNDFTWFFHQVNAFQYTSTSYTKITDDSGILFMIELSPITVRYFREVPSIFDFMVQISSVIGGIFMFLKVIDMYVFNLYSKLIAGQ